MSTSTDRRRRPSQPPIELPEGVDHGTPQGYRKGCRCDDCRDAIAAYELERQRARGVKPKQRRVPKVLDEVEVRHGGSISSPMIGPPKPYFNKRTGELIAHGKESTYTKRGCRCWQCYEAHQEHGKKYRKTDRPWKTKRKHGTLAMYRAGCTCDPCTQANNDRVREQLHGPSLDEWLFD